MTLNTESKKHMWNFKQYHQDCTDILMLLSRYWLRAPWRWYNSVETCRSSI